MKRLLLSLCIGATGLTNAYGAALNLPTVAEKYEDLLLLNRQDFQQVAQVNTLFNDTLLKKFSAAVNEAKIYDYSASGKPAYFDFKIHAESDASTELLQQQKQNDKLYKLFTHTLPLLAYAYLTPGPVSGDNPYYHNKEVLDLYISALEYTYSRGLTEHTWMPDHAGDASKAAMAAGHKRLSGDYSSVSLHFGGFVQSIFLLKEQLAERRLLDKYRNVVRNIVVNNGVMYPVFFDIARPEAGTDYPKTLSADQQYYLNADGIRLFVDYFMPYFLMLDDQDEIRRMSTILQKVVDRNIKINVGSQGTIKPDGVGFHHHTAYIAGYSPFTFEAFAQLLYLLSGSDLYDQENVDAVKFALETYRLMTQKYDVSASLKGRLISSDPEGASIAITKAMALMAHPQGLNDTAMQARFKEFFAPDFFYSGERLSNYYQGKRGVEVRGLGIFGLNNDVLTLKTPPADTPHGTWIKPYAAAGFFRRDNWLVTAKGFSQYFFDYEGPLNKRQNSFGQNFSYGLLDVYSAGDPVSAKDSGYNYDNGWDWYHMPGTTASHYPIEKRSEKKVKTLRKKQKIRQRSTHRNYNSKTYVGGVTLGDNGFFVQDLEALPFTAPTDLTARKSYFFVGDKVLALGSDISGGTSKDETHTTLFQTHLPSASVTTYVNGKKLTGLNSNITIPAGSSAAITDSVGNSFYLAESSADLAITRQVQKSMTPRYKPTKGAFKQAYINHGIKPDGDHYEYVLIPADRDGSKLKALAVNPEAFYRVIDGDKNMHLVEFPTDQLTAYAFYDRKARTPETYPVKAVNLSAALLQKSEGNNLRIAASVPDIGWSLDKREVARSGLAKSKDYFIYQPAKEHELLITLRGNWQLDKPMAGVTVKTIRKDETTVSLNVQDGLSKELLLKPAA